jgi:hypothetical protein
MTEAVAVVDKVAVVAPLIHEAVVVGLIFEAEVVDLIFGAEAVGLTFEAEEAVLVEALVADGNREGKLSTCNYLSEGLLLIQCPLASSDPAYPPTSTLV